MKYYVVDVFTDKLFHGNPAGVCLLDKWPEDSVMQQIAFENNLAETAFLVRQNGYYDLRWFTRRKSKLVFAAMRRSAARSCL